MLRYRTHTCLEFSVAFHTRGAQLYLTDFIINVPRWMDSHAKIQYRFPSSRDVLLMCSRIDQCSLIVWKFIRKSDTSSYIRNFEKFQKIETSGNELFFMLEKKEKLTSFSCLHKCLSEITSDVFPWPILVRSSQRRTTFPLWNMLPSGFISYRCVHAPVCWKSRTRVLRAHTIIVSSIQTNTNVNE